jgi:hypothetical protein
MKNVFVWSVVFSVVFGVQSASAQFPIKIPKIKTGKPPAEQPKVETSKPADSGQPEATTPRTSGGDYDEPAAPSKPMFLKETFEITAKTEARYWKVPNKNDNPSWFPQVEFKVFYDDSVRQRFNSEWFNPDGTAWYTEQLDYLGIDGRNISIVRSPSSSESPNPKATQAIGTYTFKIVNTKTNETVMQGKYKVKKIAYDPKIGTNGIFYVDNEWTMPIGYAGLAADDWNSSVVHPVVLMWFKGDFDSKDFEARLFHNGQEIFTSDEGGILNRVQSRGGDCYLYAATCQYKLWTFAWGSFYVLKPGASRGGYESKALFTRDKPGEYTAKIFHKGVQVREAKFSFDKGGAIVPTAYSTGIYPTLSLIPVKVMGTAEKYNSSTWMNEAFYGNPLPGFVMP